VLLVRQLELAGMEGGTPAWTAPQEGQNSVMQDLAVVQDMMLMYQEKELRARTMDLAIVEAWATMHSARCTISRIHVLALVWKIEKI